MIPDEDLDPRLCAAVVLVALIAALVFIAYGSPNALGPAVHVGDTLRATLYQMKEEQREAVALGACRCR